MRLGLACRIVAGLAFTLSIVGASARTQGTGGASTQWSVAKNITVA